VLRDPSCLDALLDAHGPSAVLAAAEAEGVDRLIADVRPDVPAFAARRRQAALEDVVKVREMRRVCSTIAARGIMVAVMKGGSLACTHYEHSWCRPRLDLDVLVSAPDRDRAAVALAELDYVRAGRIAGEWINRQDAWQRRGEAGVLLVVDLHWEATNRAFVSARLPAADLLARSRPAPFAGDGARQLEAVDQLLVACVHRAAHHADHMRLIWRCDEWRLGRALTPDEVETFVDRARRAGVASLCARDLREAREWLGPADGALSDTVIRALDEAGAGEFARRFLTAGRSRIGDVWLDVRSLPRWRDRILLVREHLLPSPSFVREHAGGRVAWLPWLYVRRVAIGAWRWIREAAS
jgi:hypothetical protein